MGAIRTLPNHLETSSIELEECSDKLSGVTRSIRYLANCDLASGVRTLSSVEEDELRAHLSTMMGNLSAVIAQTRECSESFLAALPKIGALANQTDEYTALMEKINLQFSDLSEAIQKNACLTEELQSIADVTGDDAQVAKDTVQTVVAAMDDIALHSNQISQFTEIVDQIAFQTNLLALNAAVEAARAGEEGRGFAVVANEVRNLAQRSGSAAKEITHFINESTQSVNSGRESVADVSQKMTKVSSRVDTLKDLIQDVSNTTQYQGEKFEDVKGTVEELDAFALQNAAMAEDVLKVAEQLNDNADYLNNTVSIFQMPKSFTHPVHQRMLAHAIECAEEVSALFEWAIEEGQIETQSLFSREYEVIPNTNPTRYHTPFDHFCDRYLPIIQEAIIQCDPEVVFAITADNNGYVPTHNDEFCQPLTGNPKFDTAHNRTKRIFDDHVGKMVGRHTKDYLLQIYRRDTGVIMFDISVPIYVNGQHWGGFRVGYKIS